MPNIGGIPFSLKLNEVAAVLGVGIGTVRDLVKARELDGLVHPGGSLKVLTQSVIVFLGKLEFKKRWPAGFGKVDFEENGKRK